MQDGIFKRGKRTQRTGYIHTKHIYLLHTYIQPRQSCNVQARKSNTTDYDYSMYRHLTTGLLKDTAPQHALKSKGNPHRQGGRQGPWTFITWDLEDRTGPARPWQVTCTLEVPRWSASSLRRSSHGHAKPRHTASRAAPPVRVSNDQVAHRTTSA